jgi:hypothetical protein
MDECDIMDHEDLFMFPLADRDGINVAQNNPAFEIVWVHSIGWSYLLNSKVTPINPNKKAVDDIL